MYLCLEIGLKKCAKLTNETTLKCAWLRALLCRGWDEQNVILTPEGLTVSLREHNPSLGMHSRVCISTNMLQCDKKKYAIWCRQIRDFLPEPVLIRWNINEMPLQKTKTFWDLSHQTNIRNYTRK